MFKDGKNNLINNYDACKLRIFIYKKIITKTFKHKTYDDILLILKTNVKNLKICFFI